jgi:S1-C subfamily serine protease
VTAKTIAQDAIRVFEANRNSICVVKYFKNIASPSQIGSFTKIKQNRIGIIVKPDGLVMVSSDVYPLSLDIVSGGGASFYSGEPSDFKVKLFNDKEYEAEFVGKDDLAKVAFIKINDESLSEPLPYIEFSSTSDIRIGEPIYLLELLGESMDFKPLLTPAVINAIIEKPRKKFLLNQKLNSLSPGGTVFTQEGEAIGVTIRSRENYGFHEPMDYEGYGNSYIEIAPSEWLVDLINNPPQIAKEYYKGKSWLGIRMQALTPELRDNWKISAEGGVVIDQVYAKSPAEKAKLKVRDVILAFNDNDLSIKMDEELEQFRELITQQPTNSKVKLSVFRDGKVIEKQVILDAAPTSIDRAEKYQLVSLGLEVREITRDILYDYNLPLSTEGVYVFQVDRASPSGLAGLSIGSIITEVDDRKVHDLNAFKKIMDENLAKNPKKIMFRIQIRRLTSYAFVEVK